MNNANQSHHKTRPGSSWANKVLCAGLLVLVTILPVFVLPMEGISSEAGKVFLVEFFALGLLLVWLAGQLQARKINVSQPVFSGVFLLFSFVTLLAAVFSKDFGLSMFGENFTSSEGLFLVSLGIIGFLAVQVFSSFKKTIALYAAVLLPFVVVLCIQVFRFLFGPDLLSFGVLTSDVTTLVGGWNDLGLYSGFALLAAVTGLEFLELKKTYRRLASVLMVLGLLGLLLTNVPLAWITVATVSFLTFLYQTAFRKELTPKTTKWRLSVLSLSIFIFAILGYAFVGDLAQSGLSLVRPIGYSEVRLSLGATASTVGEAWSQNFITGIGPNHFGYLWQETRNEIISRIPFSDARFQFGYSTFFTLFGTLGVAGGLVLLLILARFLKSGFRVIFLHHNDKVQRFFTVSTFVLSLYLWLLMVIYVPGTTLMFYAFVFMGVFAALSGKQAGKQWTINLRGEKRYSIFVVTVFLVTALIGVGAHQNIRKLRGVVAFRSAVYAPSVQLGYEQGLKAARLRQEAPYYRALSNLVRQQALQLSNQIDINENEEGKSQLEFFLGQALTFANQAVEENTLDYRNWLTLGDTHATLNSFDVLGAYLNSRQAYEQALIRNPRAHDVLSRLALLEIGQQNYAEAQQIVNDMILRRPTDAQALVIGAQISYLNDRADVGDLYLVDAVRVSEDFGSIMQIGIYAYNEGRFDLSRQIFELALSTNPSSVDAALGLAYALDAAGETEAAQQIIEALVATGALQQNNINAERPGQLPVQSESDSPTAIAETADLGEMVDPGVEAAEPISLDSSAE